MKYESVFIDVYVAVFHFLQQVVNEKQRHKLAYVYKSLTKLVRTPITIIFNIAWVCAL